MNYLYYQSYILTSWTLYNSLFLHSGDFDNPQSTDWWTGITKTENSTKFMESSCDVLHIIDRIILCVEVLMFVIKNIWFFVRINQNNVAHISKQKHFVDLTSFQEFTMPDPLTWIRPDKNTRDSLIRAGSHHGHETLGKDSTTSSKYKAAEEEQKK